MLSQAYENEQDLQSPSKLPSETETDTEKCVTYERECGWVWGEDNCSLMENLE